MCIGRSALVVEVTAAAFDEATGKWTVRLPRW